MDVPFGYSITKYHDLVESYFIINDDDSASFFTKEINNKIGPSKIIALLDWLSDPKMDNYRYFSHFCISNKQYEHLTVESATKILLGLPATAFFYKPNINGAICAHHQFIFASPEKSGSSPSISGYSDYLDRSAQLISELNAKK